MGRAGDMGYQLQNTRLVLHPVLHHSCGMQVFPSEKLIISQVQL